MCYIIGGMLSNRKMGIDMEGILREMNKTIFIEFHKYVRWRCYGLSTAQTSILCAEWIDWKIQLKNKQLQFNANNNYQVENMYNCVVWLGVNTIIVPGLIGLTHILKWLKLFCLSMMWDFMRDFSVFNFEQNKLHFFVWFIFALPLIFR